jgi:hypothetical protein
MTNRITFGTFSLVIKGSQQGWPVVIMEQEKQSQQRVLIVSTHALFGNGLRSLLRERWSDQVTVVGMVSELSEALTALETLRPDLAVIDYDDQGLNRDEFLGHFWSGKHPLRVVLLSLNDGREGAEATVYDRRTMVASRIDEWLERGTLLEYESRENEQDRGDNL